MAIKTNTRLLEKNGYKYRPRSTPCYLFKLIFL